MSDKQQTGTGRGWQHLARQFDLVAKGCRSLGLDSVEDDMRSLEAGALAGDVTAEQLADLVHYDYSTNQDGKEAARLLFEAVLSDLRERSAYDDMKAALEPFACLKIPAKPQGNAGAYSIRFEDIERAAAALSHHGEKQ